jgi:hypothetical protein
MSVPAVIVSPVGTGRKSTKPGLSEKEKLLFMHISNMFAELGPEAMALMALIVMKPTDPPKKKKLLSAADALKVAQKNTLPSLRAIERFFQRVARCDSEKAYWRVRPCDAGSGIVPAQVCANDPWFRNDHHVVPVHIFASLKRMTTMWQKRYVDNFGRRTEALDWPFPTTICQANCFWWLFSEQILQRLRLLTAAVPEPTKATKAFPTVAGAKRPQRDSSTSRKKTVKRAKTGSKTEQTKPHFHAPPPIKARAPPTAAGGAKSKPRDLYLFDYPRYVRMPPPEGGSYETELLPILMVSSLVLERHYAGAVERMLMESVSAAGISEPFCNSELAEQLPYLFPVKPLAPAPPPPSQALPAKRVIVRPLRPASNQAPACLGLEMSVPQVEKPVGAKSATIGHKWMLDSLSGLPLYLFPKGSITTKPPLAPRPLPALFPLHPRVKPSPTATTRGAKVSNRVQSARRTEADELSSMIGDSAAKLGVSFKDVPRTTGKGKIGATKGKAPSAPTPENETSIGMSPLRGDLSMDPLVSEPRPLTADDDFDDAVFDSLPHPSTSLVDAFANPDPDVE